MFRDRSSGKVRLALELLEKRVTPTANLVGEIPDFLDSSAGSVPSVVGDWQPELPSGRNGLFDQIENGFFGAIRGDGDGSSILRIGNNFKTLPSPEVVGILGLPADQAVWLVSENSPLEVPKDPENLIPVNPVLDRALDNQIATTTRMVSPIIDDGETFDWHGNLDDLIHWDGGDPDFLDSIPSDLIDNPDKLIPWLGEIGKALPEDWESIGSWIGTFETTVTVGLSSFSFSGQDGVNDGQMVLFTTPDKIWIDSRDGLSDQDQFGQDLAGIGGLTNINWLFTQQGTYALGLTVTVSVTIGADTQTFTNNIDMKVVVGDVMADPLLVGSVGGGADSVVTIINPMTNRQEHSFIAYPGYLGGVETAVADVTGDGNPDIVTAPAGSGAPSHITVRDGVTQGVVASFYSFPGFLGKITIGAGDVDDDGFADLVVGVAENGPSNIAIFSGAGIAQGKQIVMDSFYAFDPQYQGGVTLADGDLDGNGDKELVVASAFGTTPNVTTWQFKSHDEGFKLISSYFAFDRAYMGGVSVTCLDENHDGREDVVTGSKEGVTPTVVVFDGGTSEVLQAFYPYKDYPANIQVISRGIDVSSVKDSQTGRESLVVTPVGGRASLFESAAEWEEYYRSAKQLPTAPVDTATPPDWWNGTGVLQIDLETHAIQREWNFFPEFNGAVNVSS